MNPFLSWLEKNPAFKFCVIFISGILIGSIFFIPLFITVSVPVFLFISFLKFRNSVILFLAIFSIGVLKSNLDFFVSGNDNVSKFPDLEKFEVTISGVVSSVISQNEDEVKFIIDSKYIYNQSDSLNINGKVLVKFFKGDYVPENISFSDIKQNYYVKITGRLNSPYPPKNPGDFNYARYLKLNGINKTLTSFNPEQCEILSTSYSDNYFSNLVFTARNYSDKVIEKYYTGDNKGFVEGLVTGQRDDISEETKINFINTGIMHILAVSGFNVAVVSTFIIIALSLFRLKRQHAILVAIPFLIFYCFFTTMAPSIIRATIMGILVIIGILIERKLEFYNIVAVSAILILAIDAKQIYDAGFILSYIAVISMVFVYENVFLSLEKKLSKNDFTNNKFFRICMGFVLISISAIIGTIPVSAFYFHKIPIVSVIANIIAVPAANLILITSFLQIIFEPISQFLSSAVSYLNNFVLNGLFLFIGFIANLKYAYISFYKFNLFNIIIYYSVLIILVTSSKLNFLKRIIFSCLIILFAVIVNSINSQNHQLTILSYHNSDVILIQGDNGINILAFKGHDFRNVKNRLIPYLHSIGIKKIDALILTDVDINEGVIYEFKNGIPIGEIYAPHHNNFKYNQIGSGFELKIDNNSYIYFTRPYSNEISKLNFIYKTSTDIFEYSNEGMKINNKSFDPQKTGALIFKTSHNSNEGLILSDWR